MGPSPGGKIAVRRELRSQKASLVDEWHLEDTKSGTPQVPASQRSNPIKEIFQPWSPGNNPHTELLNTKSRESSSLMIGWNSMKGRSGRVVSPGS